MQTTTSYLKLLYKFIQSNSVRYDLAFPNRTSVNFTVHIFIIHDVLLLREYCTNTISHKTYIDILRDLQSRCDLPSPELRMLPLFDPTKITAEILHHNWKRN